MLIPFSYHMTVEILSVICVKLYISLSFCSQQNSSFTHFQGNGVILSHLHILYLSFWSYLTYLYAILSFFHCLSTILSFLEHNAICYLSIYVYNIKAGLFSNISALFQMIKCFLIIGPSLHSSPLPSQFQAFFVAGSRSLFLSRMPTAEVPTRYSEILIFFSTFCLGDYTKTIYSTKKHYIREIVNCSMHIG